MSTLRWIGKNRWNWKVLAFNSWWAIKVTWKMYVRKHSSKNGLKITFWRIIKISVKDMISIQNYILFC